MSRIDPLPGQHTHDRPPPGPHREERRRSTTRRTAPTVRTAADVAAGLLVLWIALHLLGANEANVFVEFVHDAAELPARWSQDVFTMGTENLRVLLDHGLPALVCLAVGHGIAARLDHA
ncbi:MULTISPECIES: hypothetical protein [Streptomyces]|uniref:Uncharacterized protein n=1 Tax=Streptomyces fimbriatus TaxID=68197 RepID=A0ABW0D278_STRFI